MTPSMQGKIAVVTGGSSGIGAATVRMLADLGAAVCIGYNSGRERAEALAATLPGSGHSIERIVLQDSVGIAALREHIGARYGRLDALINSAGITRAIPHKDLDALDDTTFDEIMTVNVRGTFSVIRALVPLLRESGAGVVVSVSSLSALTGSGSSVAYCASKAALDTMTMSLARVLGPQIRLLCVSPAAVATDFVPGRGRTQIEAQAATTPLKRVVEPEDVASAIVACITHLTTATGTTIVVDGGRHL